MSEVGESPSQTGLAHIFSRSRNRDKSKRNSTTNASILSSESDGTLSLRRSVDGSFERDEEHHGSGVKKKLVDKTIGRRKRKKQELAEEQLASEEAERGRSVAERGTLQNDGVGAITFRDAQDDEGDDDDHGDQSSLITYDEELTEPNNEKPTLTSHNSHIGYLTSSSPLIPTTSLSATTLPDAQSDGTPTPRVGTFPRHITTNLAATESTPSLDTNALRAPEDGSRRRSPSPVGRLRDALKSKKSASPNTSPERKPKGAGASTTSLVADNRRGSVSSRLGLLFPERANTVPVQPPAVVTSTPERPKTAKISTVDINATPTTPPSSGDVAPIIVNTPPTPTDFSQPRFPPNNRDRGSSDPVASNSNVVTSPSGNMISHRRVRSGSATLGPSKLSNIQSAPLTPTPEHPSPNPSQQTGFFSSVFSAAQNAANTLTNSIGNNNNSANRNKNVAQPELKEVESPVVELLEKTNNSATIDEKEPAVKTLGMGDLSLSHLGISENSISNTPTSMKFPDESRGRSESAATNDDPYGSRSVLGPPLALHDGQETGSTTNFDDVPAVRPRSLYEPSAGDRTPPNGSVFEGNSGVQRSGSMRSAMGQRRKRNSSATTGGGISAIGAAIAAANTSIANPKGPSEGPKITGFAVASKKRNRDFHQLFRSVPDDDYLIEDYSCALQREILAHGRLYVSEGHLCFSSNIFGWVTTLVMSFDEIVSVEKRSTALLFKNGLMISTLHAKNVFASFTSRDSTYDLIVGIWKLGHPSLRSSLNGVQLGEAGGGDKTEKYDGKPEETQSVSGSETDDGSGDEVYDEDEDEDGSSQGAGDGSVAGSDGADKVVSRKASAAVVTGTAPTDNARSDAPVVASSDFPGPATHAPTECTDGDSHYTRIIADEIIPAPLGKIYNLLFGAPSVPWMKNWLITDQKCQEVVMDDLALSQENKSRGYSYIKPLNGSIGPKQTKCICTENLDFLDLEKAVSVSITTQTPDVPSGNVFSTKTKYCLTWAEGNATRLQMNCTIEWTGKSWLKGPIEKGANDGQIKHAKDLVASIKGSLSSSRGPSASGGKGKKKGRKGKDSKSAVKATAGDIKSKPSSEDWGVFEPIHGIAGPVVDIIKPLLTGNVLYGILVGILVASWFRFGLTGSGGHSRDMSMFGSSDRIAAYEEIWRREESELWEWLEDRVGMDRLRDVGSLRAEQHHITSKLKDERMDARAVDAAVRVTEERLKVLKHALDGKRKSQPAADV